MCSWELSVPARSAACPLGRPHVDDDAARVPVVVHGRVGVAPSRQGVELARRARQLLEYDDAPPAPRHTCPATLTAVEMKYISVALDNFMSGTETAMS